MYITTVGLVLRETAYKESSKILTVLTSAKGKITVNAKGVKRKGSKNGASAQLLTCSEMTLYEGKSGYWTLTESRSLEEFNGLRNDLTLLALGSYFAELLDVVCADDCPEPEILALGLNSLYALSEEKYKPEFVKAVFEMRLMCLVGFLPAVEFCPVCGKSEIVDPVIDLSGGNIRCRKCSGEHVGIPLSQGTLSALRYIVNAQPKKIFSFKINDSTLKILSDVCESYTLQQLERGFGTLDFYKSLL